MTRISAIAPLLAALLFVACRDDGSDNNDTSAGDVGGDGSDRDATSCIEPVAGAWRAEGECFGMEMTADLTVESDGCAFTLADWNMAMPVPEGAVLEGSGVTFTGPDFADCTGVISADGASITASCSDGCDFSMAAL